MSRGKGSLGSRSEILETTKHESDFWESLCNDCMLTSADALARESKSLMQPIETEHDLVGSLRRAIQLEVMRLTVAQVSKSARAVTHSPRLFKIRTTALIIRGDAEAFARVFKTMSYSQKGVFGGPEVESEGFEPLGAGLGCLGVLDPGPLPRPSSWMRVW